MTVTCRCADWRARSPVTTSSVPSTIRPSSDPTRSSTISRTPEKDEELLRNVNCDLLHRPSAAELYPNGLVNAVRIDMPGIADVLCGGLRPGHFEALAGTVNRLFNIVQPGIAIFGEKDFQQLVLIRRMVDELRMPINIVGAPVVRTPDGLAMSSRNQYLNER